MTNWNALLGRSKPSEKLSKEEIASLDRVTAPPAPATKPPKTTGKTGGGQQQRMVRRDLLKLPLEPRLLRLRLQGRGRRPAQTWAKAGAVRPLQAGPSPGRQVAVQVPDVH